ncbi:hypothetical protein [Pseudomonas citronellolis]|uniref:hypothetical protein n=1 Tax=Pseudomonas citronellolis TaxID=53408 RepID=UPI0023E44D36|nr:hypothetical protein [Pseudomonas citronellolis]MDF3933066.1 hypothetical protein [Pseudomonas citronellolis]
MGPRAPLGLAPLLAALGGSGPLACQAGVAGHWCIHDLFRALGALTRLIGA